MPVSMTRGAGVVVGVAGVDGAAGLLTGGGGCAAHDRAVVPRWPMTDSTSAPSMNKHREDRRQLGEQRGAAARAERGLAAASAEGARHVAALALLQQDHQQQNEADEHVEGGQK